MHRTALCLSLFLSGCAIHAAAPGPDANALASAPAPTPPGPQVAAPAQPPQAEVAKAPQPAAVQPANDDESAEGAAEEDEPGESADPADSGDVGESHETAPVVAGEGTRYTADLSDQELAERWKSSPERLGSISIGFVDEGRLINGERFPEGDSWIVVQPTWGTKETIDFIIAAIRQVKAQFPNAPPLRVNQISGPEGGYLRPHKSHQNGRDADLAFYYPTAEPVRARERERYIDVPKTWALLKAVVTAGDVQFVLVDKHVQKVLFDYALSIGEDRDWLDSLFHSEHPLVMHARHHRDHFHVRFYNARAQELGRRVTPLLAMRPDQNLRTHRVRRGDTLGGIAARYGSSVTALRSRNHLRSNLLRISQVLMVPLRGPCTQCPVPPPVIIPERRLPPKLASAEVPAAAAPAPVAVVPASAVAPAAPAEVPGPAAPAGAELEIRNAPPEPAATDAAAREAVANAAASKEGGTAQEAPVAKEAPAQAVKAAAAPENAPAEPQPAAVGAPAAAQPATGTGAEPDKAAAAPEKAAAEPEPAVVTAPPAPVPAPPPAAAGAAR